MKPNKAVVYIVVGSLAYVLVAYATTLMVTALCSLQVAEVVLTHFKEIAIFTGGAVAGLLARTSNQTDEGTKLLTDNNKPVSEDNPLPTSPQP